MPYKIIDGKKHMENQKKYDLPQCNVKLLKKVEMGNKVFPVGWCMQVSHATKEQWISDKIAESYSHKEEGKTGVGFKKKEQAPESK